MCTCAHTSSIMQDLVTTMVHMMYVTLRVQQLGPSDVYMRTHVITVVTGELVQP